MDEDGPAALLDALAAEVAFASPDSLRVVGRTYPFAPHLPTVAYARPPYPPVVGQMAQTLYETFYAAGGLGPLRTTHAAREADARGARPSPLLPAQPATDPASYPDALLEAEFVRHLARHHAPEESVSRGWRLVSASDAGCLVQDTDGKQRKIPAGALSADVVGGLGDIRIPRGTAEEGWYHVRGATPLFPDVTPTVRVYWSLSRMGGARFIRAATGELDARRVPFQLKVSADPRRFSRVDAGVLYVPREGWDATSGCVARIHEEVARYLKPATAPFVKPLAPGVGLAEDPGGPESFGVHRCRLAAEGLWDACLASPQGADARQRAEAMRARFLREDIDPARPYLGPGGTDVYPPLRVAATVREVDPLVQ